MDTDARLIELVEEFGMAYVISMLSNLAYETPETEIASEYLDGARQALDSAEAKVSAHTWIKP